MILLRVPQQIPLLPERHRTLGATKRLLVTVHALMQLHFMFHPKPPLTHGTLKRPLVRVNPQVLLQHRPRSKPRPAHLTVELKLGTVRPLVHKQGRLLLERLPALGTAVRPVARVNVLVLAQIGSTGKGHAALAAAELLHLVVKLLDVPGEAGEQSKGFLAQPAVKVLFIPVYQRVPVEGVNRLEDLSAVAAFVALFPVLVVECRSFHYSPVQLHHPAYQLVLIAAVHGGHVLD